MKDKSLFIVILVFLKLCGLLICSWLTVLLIAYIVYVW